MTLQSPSKNGSGKAEQLLLSTAQRVVAQLRTQSTTGLEKPPQPNSSQCILAVGVLLRIVGVHSGVKFQQLVVGMVLEVVAHSIFAWEEEGYLRKCNDSVAKSCAVKVSRLKVVNGELA